jgi:hypothetical protein
MTPTPGSLRQFAAKERKAIRFCWRMVARNTVAAVKRKFSKSATDHEDQAESVEQFIQEGYHNAARN